MIISLVTFLYQNEYCIQIDFFPCYEKEYLLNRLILISIFFTLSFLSPTILQSTTTAQVENNKELTLTSPFAPRKPD